MDIATMRAAVFDLGDTLWFQATSPDFDRVFRLQSDAVAPLLGAWGVALDAPIEALLAGIWRAYSVAEQKERTHASLREPSLPALIRGALAERGVELSAAQAEAWHRAAWVSEATFGLQLYPDAIDVLRELRAMDIAIGIISNRPCTGDMALPGLRDLGIAPYVDAVVCSGDTGYVKPHPSTFKLVLDRLGVAAGDAVMVGDLRHADMIGARAVGMRTVWKLNGRYDLPPCSDADYAIHQLGELLSLPIIPRRARQSTPAESLTPHDDNNEDRY